MASILSRPLFAPDRRPQQLAITERALPRLAGLVLTPRLRLALLQSDPSGHDRSHVVGLGGSVAGWRLVRIDMAGVVLERASERLRIGLRQAPPQPVPLDRVVMMPTKRTNPQLAW